MSCARIYSRLQKTYLQAREALGRLLFIIPKTPSVAQISITNVCNFDCKMCPRNYLNIKQKHMDYGLFKNVVDRLGGVRSVQLFGWGEPTCHPRFIDMVRYAKAKGLEVSTTSNGSLVTGKLQEMLVDSDIDIVVFSIDDTINEENSVSHIIMGQLENIRQFSEKLRKRGKDTRIILQPAYHKAKEESIFRVMEFAAAIGAEVNVNRLYIKYDKKLKRPTYKEEKALVATMVKKADELGIVAEFRCHTVLSGFKRAVARRLIPFFHEGGKHCLRVYNYVYIGVDGYVTPCCGLPDYRAGNIVEEGLESIWKSKAFRDFRKSDFQRRVCEGCDVLEIYQLY